MWPWLRFGEIAIPSFVLVQSLNASFLLWWMRDRAARFEIDEKKALDLTVLILCSGLIGGRLLHVLWEAPSFYFENPLEILNLINGGYVYYGGLILGLIATGLFFRAFPELEKAKWFDVFAAPLSLGTAIGRIGCLLAGCCYGKACDLPWATLILDEKGIVMPRHPTPLYSIAWELVCLFLLLKVEKTPAPRRIFATLRPAGALFALWMILHGIGRFFIEFWRDDFRGPTFLFSVSQWLSLALVLGGCLVLRQRNRQTLESS